MMKLHRSSRGRMLGGAAAIALLAGIGLAVGGPGFAQPAPPAPPSPPEAQSPAPHDGVRRERVIVRTINRDGHEETTTERIDGDDHAGPGERRERVIIMDHRGEGHGEGHGAGNEGAHGDAADHHMMMMHRGEGGHVAIADCGRGTTELNANEGDDHQRTRIVLCSRGEATPAQRVEHLQRARDRLAQNTELSAEQRARITATLDQHIARLRAQ